MIAHCVCRCNKCDLKTAHDKTESKGVVRCQVCRTLRHYYKPFGAGDFPELTDDENETIHEARACGFGSSFPAYPTAESQALSTLKAAQKWLTTHSVENDFPITRMCST